ncbi:hypothetical protein FMEXI_8183 [Fusarium mexicanum]|uniref:Uncharacterized protein n=1 Tax=Fusarium mexicanum TaxID=751941 RepID=A0A8H5IRI4_9HYPO|nr:hypothetical protein FMEXI_8183 [Fusarium mexicanum]
MSRLLYKDTDRTCSQAGQEEDQQSASNTPSTKKIKLLTRPRQGRDEPAAIKDNIAGDIDTLLEDEGLTIDTETHCQDEDISGDVEMLPKC